MIAVDDRPDACRALSAKTLAALSGGVDSAVAAALAVRDGHDAVAVTMRLWTPGEGEASEKARQCCGPSAFDDARRAAAAIGVPHYVLNFESAFERAVVDYFCAEYLAGRTPNPCVACNNLIKFGALLRFARALGAARIVTGHYARIVADGEAARLLRAVDRSKDQSYMLAGLRPEQLRYVVTPLGAMTKQQTRDAAREFGIDIADKPDSVDLCFVDGDYRRFIVRRYPDSARPGPLRTLDGRIVGEHGGIIGFTIGQRKGIEASAAGDGPWYVIKTDNATNSVIVGRREELARDVVVCSNANVLRPELFADGEPVEGLAACRYRSPAVAARASLENGRLIVRLACSAPLVSPGQLLVLYDGRDEEVLASGVIEAA